MFLTVYMGNLNNSNAFHDGLTIFSIPYVPAKFKFPSVKIVTPNNSNNNKKNPPN